MNVLVVHRDAAERKLLETMLRGFQVQVETLDDGARAAALVKKRKFDGVFVDGELPNQGGLELVRQVRKSPSNKKAPVVLISNPSSSIRLGDAFQAGVTFFLTCPLDQKKVSRLLNATRGSMLAERRSYHRLPLQAPVRFKVGSKAGQGTSINISRSGILFQAQGLLKAGDTVEMEFGLPQQGVLSAQGQVARVDSAGAAGVRFTRLPAADIEKLQTFIGI